MKTLLFLALLSTASLAAEGPSVVLSYPGVGGSVQKLDIVTVVVDRGAYTVDGNVIPQANLTTLVRCVDQLRHTRATTVAVNRATLPPNADI